MENKELEAKYLLKCIEADSLRLKLTELMKKYPRRVWTCKKRDTTSVEMVDGTVVIVKRKKGEKDCLHTAICYAITKNLIGSAKLNELAKKSKNYEPKNI